jgi:hypothetical protein
MNLESCHGTKDKRRWKIVRNYSDVPGEVITADEATGQYCVQVGGETEMLKPGLARSALSGGGGEQSTIA